MMPLSMSTVLKPKTCSQEQRVCVLDVNTAGQDLLRATQPKTVDFYVLPSDGHGRTDSFTATYHRSLLYHWQCKVVQPVISSSTQTPPPARVPCVSSVVSTLTPLSSLRVMPWKLGQRSCDSLSCTVEA